MDDALGVCVGKGVRDLDSEIDGAPRVERSAGDEPASTSRRERIQRREDVTLLFANLVERRDVGMRERGGRSNIRQESLAPRRIGGDVCGQYPDCDCPAEARVAGAVQVAEPARADAVENLVDSPSISSMARREPASAGPALPSRSGRAASHRRPARGRARCPCSACRGTAPLRQ